MTKTTNGKSQISEEKRAQYEETKRIKDKTDRDRRKTEKKEGKTGDRLLAFLDNIIKASGYNHRSFAEKSGTTAQSIHWIFSVRDDCDITKVEEFLNVLGYGVSLELRANKEGAPARKPIGRTSFVSKDVSIRIEGDLVNASQKSNNYPKPEYITNYPADGRLHAIADIIRENDFTLTEFSALTGIPAYTIRQIFIKDNMRVSQVADIARALGYKIIWKLTRKQ